MLDFFGCAHFSMICFLVVLATPLWRANPMLAMLCLLVRLPAIHGLNSILLAIERRWACLISLFCTYFSRFAPPELPFGGHGRAPGGPMEAAKILEGNLGPKRAPWDPRMALVRLQRGGLEGAKC